MSSSFAATFSDPDQFQDYIRAADTQVVIVSPGDFRAELQHIELDRIVMERGRQSLGHIARVRTPADQNLFLFASDGHQPPTDTGKTTVQFGDIIWSPCGSEDYHRAPPNIRWASISPTPTDLAVAAQTLAGSALPRTGSTRVLRPSPSRMSRLLNLHRIISDLASRAPDMLAHPEVARRAEESLIRAMIACLDEHPTDATRSCSGRRGTKVMRRFERVLEGNLERPLYLTEICAQVGVSARVLRSQCHEHLGMSPHRYLWLRRMHLARRALTRADPTTTTVTRIANDLGFAELGRFAVTYRKLFGELPSARLLRPADGPRADTGDFVRSSSDSA